MSATEHVTTSLLTLAVLVFSATAATGDTHFTGRIVDCEGETDDGEDVTDQCRFYSNDYGRFDGETENGVAATGQCWRYSDNYTKGCPY